MDFDTSIFRNQPQLDIVGGVERGLKISDLIQQRRKDQAELDKKNTIRDLISKGASVDAQGNISYSPDTIKQVAAVDPASAYALSNQGMEQQKNAMALQQEKQKYHLDLVGQGAKRVLDNPTQENWVNTLNELKAKGVDVSHETLPDGSYMPLDVKHVQSLYQQTPMYQMEQKNRLTSSEIYKNNAQASQAGNDLKIALQKAKLEQLEKKRPPADVAVQLGSADAAYKALDELNAIYDKNNGEGTGPFAGSVLNPARWGNSAMSSTTEKAKLADAQRHLVAGELGKYLHGGVPDKETVESIRDSVLPQMTDTPEVRKEKLNRAKLMIQQRAESIAKNLKDAGYNSDNLEAPKGEKSKAPPIDLSFHPLENIKAEIEKRGLKINE